MTITYRTAGAWGAGKGANLTAAEVDENFHDLDTRLTAVEENPVLPAEISSITSSGSALTITMSDGTIHGPLPIAAASFNYRGGWLPATAYQNNDIVLWGFEVYFVAVSHKSAADFDPNRTISGTTVYKLMLDVYDAALLAAGEALIAGTHNGISYTMGVSGEVSASVDFSVGAEVYRDVTGAMINTGTHTGIDIVYDDPGNTLNFTVNASWVGEVAQDAAAAMLASGTHSGISFSYNDAGDAFSATVSLGFTNLSGVPASYAGQGGSFVRVKPDASGLEFVSASNVVAAASVPRFMGALLNLTTTTGQNYSSGLTVPWNVEVYDTDGFHDNVTNNTRLTIPSGLGIKKVRLVGCVRGNALTAGSDHTIVIWKNGTAAYAGNSATFAETNAFADQQNCVVSPVLSVVDGDYFELFYSTSDTSSGIQADRSFFGIEVVEVEGSINIANVLTESTTSRTLGMADINEHLLCTNSSPVTLTVPANATSAIPIGATMDIEQNGTGQVTISGAVGVTINKPSDKSLATRARYSVVRLRKVAINTWTLSGDMA